MPFGPAARGRAVTGQSLVGAVGVVHIRLRGGEEPGEVRVVVEGLPHYYLAFSTTAVEVGQHIVVIHNRGNGQVDVEPWPMADFDAGVISPQTERN